MAELGDVRPHRGVVRVAAVFPLNDWGTSSNLAHPGTLSSYSFSVQPSGASIEVDDAFELTGWREEDAEAHRRFAEDPAAARFFGWSVPVARAAPDSHYAEVVQRFQREWRDGTRYSLAIRHRVEGRAVGAVELRPGRVKRQKPRSWWHPSGAVVGSRPEPYSGWLAWGRRELGLRRALLECSAENSASRRVAEKCGFALERRDGSKLLLSLEL